MRYTLNTDTTGTEAQTLEYETVKVVGKRKKPTKECSRRQRNLSSFTGEGDSSSSETTPRQIKKRQKHQATPIVDISNKKQQNTPSFDQDMASPSGLQVNADNSMGHFGDLLVATQNQNKQQLAVFTEEELEQNQKLCTVGVNTDIIQYSDCSIQCNLEDHEKLQLKKHIESLEKEVYFLKTGMKELNELVAEVIPKKPVPIPEKNETLDSGKINNENTWSSILKRKPIIPKENKEKVKINVSNRFQVLQEDKVNQSKTASTDEIDVFMPRLANGKKQKKRIETDHNIDESKYSCQADTFQLIENFKKFKSQQKTKQLKKAPKGRNHLVREQNDEFVFLYVMGLPRMSLNQKDGLRFHLKKLNIPMNMIWNLSFMGKFTFEVLTTQSHLAELRKSFEEKGLECSIYVDAANPLKKNAPTYVYERVRGAFMKRLEAIVKYHPIEEVRALYESVQAKALNTSSGAAHHD